jgi:multidrug efflux pump subunit AcrB
MRVQLKDKHSRERSVFQVLTDVRRLARQVPEAQLRASVSSPLAGGGGGGLSIDIQGDDFTKLGEIAKQIEQVARETPGAVDVQNNAEQRDPEMRAIIDRERAADLRINATQIADSMRAMVGTVVTQLRPEVGNQIDIRVIANDAARVTPSLIGAFH